MCMSDSIKIPSDLKGCQELIAELVARNAELVAHIALQDKKTDELSTELEKLRKLLIQLQKGNQSERRVFPDATQTRLPFESEEELNAARAGAEAEAEAIIQEYTVKREIRKKKPRDESLPSDLPRVEKLADVPDEMKTCPTHGEREIIGYDITETLMREPARLWVQRTKYPKFACLSSPKCGIASPERPTSLVEGNRYDTSIAAAIIEAKWTIYLPIYRQQDVFASSGWTPSRSTLLNLISQTQFVMSPLFEYMVKSVQRDICIGLDDTSCRMLMPKDIPDVIAGDAIQLGVNRWLRFSGQVVFALRPTMPLHPPQLVLDLE